MSEARNDVRDWDAPWQAKVGRGPGEWRAEIAIPFISLGFSKPPDHALLGWVLLEIVIPAEKGVEGAETGELPDDGAGSQTRLRQVLDEAAHLANGDLVRIEGRFLCH